jgi:DNA-binding transcriptional regulator YiaG
MKGLPAQALGPTSRLIGGISEQCTQYSTQDKHRVNTWYEILHTRCEVITPMQVRLARTALGMGVRELAAAAGISPSTVQRFESNIGGMQTRTLDRVQQVLEEGGVIFISADATGGAGIRLRS